MSPVVCSSYVCFCVMIHVQKFFFRLVVSYLSEVAALRVVDGVDARLLRGRSPVVGGSMLPETTLRVCVRRPGTIYAGSEASHA